MLFCPYCFSEFKKESGTEEKKDDDKEIKPVQKTETKRKSDGKAVAEIKNKDEQGILINNRYSIIEPYHFTCSRATYKVEDVTDPGNFFSLREFLIQSANFSEREELAERFEGASEKFVGISHDSISQIADYFTEDNYLFLVYEYKDGRDLHAFLRSFHLKTQKSIPEGLAVYYALKLADLLIYLHFLEPEPIYCIDFKPSFIIVSPDCKNISYINFGMAYILDEVEMLETGESLYIKTMKEQYKSPQRDLFCLGSIVYYLLTAVDIQKSESAPIVPIEKLRPDLTKNFTEILNKLLGENQMSFYDDAKVFKKEIMEKCKALQIKSYDFYYDLIGLDTSNYSWDTYLGNNSRTNSLGKGPSIPMKLQWNTLTKKSSQITLLPYLDKIIAVFNDGEFLQLNPVSGKTEWQYKLKETVNPPVIMNNHIYLSASSTSSMFSINIGKTNVKWETQTEGMMLSSPCLTEEMAYFATYDGTIIAVELDEGEIFWKEPLNVRLISHPAIQKSNLYLSSLNGIVYAINLDDRDFLWQFDTEGSISSSPAIMNEWLLIGNHEGYLFCLELENGDLRWEHNLGSSITTPARATDEVIICATKKGVLYCLNPDSGDIIWKTDLDANSDYHYAVTNNRIYLSLPENRLHCIDIFSGKLLDRIKLEDKIISIPLVFNGSLYIAIQSGNIYCYR